MKKRQILIILLTFVSSICNLFAQKNNLVLKIGDQLPDMEFNIYTNGDIKKGHLSDYKGKHLIFDFWSVYCPPCIAAMPDALQLQQKYKDKIDIVYVTPKGENVELIKAFFLKQSNSKYPNKEIIEAGKKSAFIYSDSVFFKTYFKTRFLGTKAWIDKEQKFRYLSLDPLTEENIKSFLNGNDLKVTDYVYPTIVPSAWIKNRIGYQDHLIKYSFLSKYDEAVVVHENDRISWLRDSITKKVFGIRAINLSIPELYDNAYWGKSTTSLVGPNADLIIIEGKQTREYFQNRFKLDEFFKWQKENQYCYATDLPATDSISAKKKMIADLDQYFNIRSSTEKRRVKCFVLRQTNNQKLKPVSKNDNLKQQVEVANGRLVIKGGDIASLFSEVYSDYFFGRNLRVPLYNETTYQGTVDIDIAWGKDDWSMQSLNKELKKYGLAFVEEEFEREVVVLREM